MLCAACCFCNHHVYVHASKCTSASIAFTFDHFFLKNEIWTICTSMHCPAQISLEWVLVPSDDHNDQAIYPLVADDTWQRCTRDMYDLLPCGCLWLMKVWKPQNRVLHFTASHDQSYAFRTTLVCVRAWNLRDTCRLSKQWAFCGEQTSRVHNPPALLTLTFLGEDCRWAGFKDAVSLHRCFVFFVHDNRIVVCIATRVS